MTFDIPATIEPDVIQYATAQRITEHEAIVRLIQAGLKAQQTEDARIQALLGEPMNEEDAALMDEVVAEAYRMRGQRWCRDSGL